MRQVLLWGGRLAGLAGVILIAIAAVVRLGGAYHLAGFQLGTLLQAGIAAIVFASFALLLVLTHRSPNK